MKIDMNKMHFSDDELREIFILYAKENKMSRAIDIYRELYPDSNRNEALRLVFFIRLAFGLDISQDYY